MLISDNIEKIEERIQSACRRAGRNRNEITLMGVTKFVPLDLIKKAFNAGIRCFGESRVKEAAEKFTDFKNDYKEAQLHMIGSLQRNKAKQAALLFDCIQSADRLELIEELSKHSMSSKPLDILLELHTGEETKSGFADTFNLLKAAEMILNNKNFKSRGLKSCGLRPAGLMTMAPFTDNKDLIRSSFRRLVSAQSELLKHFPLKSEEGNWNCLSMGMSNDFEIAVEEGSTLLRIGSAIFKE